MPASLKSPMSRRGNGETKISTRPRKKNCYPLQPVMMLTIHKTAAENMEALELLCLLLGSLFQPESMEHWL